MKLNLSPSGRNMEVGTPAFLWMRAAMHAASRGADVSECLQVAARITAGDDASWVREWRGLAEALEARARASFASGQRVSGRNALMRASSCYRSALIRCHWSDRQADELLTRSRECFEEAGASFDPPIERVRVPYQGGVLPAYFVSAGQPSVPTLIGANGGDSTNEELFQTLGFGARERGWNFLVFEGPGQYTARQLNPGLTLRADWEGPTGAVINWLLKRPEVDPKRLALFGWSLSSNLALRAAAFDNRVAAVISNGLVVDVYEAWFGVWPWWMRRASAKRFDAAFHLLERLSPQVRALTGIFYALHGVDSPAAMIQAWRPFNISELADKVECPALFILGEAELAEQSAGPPILSNARFLARLKGPGWVHEFGFEDGWAASHCQIGAPMALEKVVYDWLDMVLVHPERQRPMRPRHDFARMLRYFGKMEGLKELSEQIQLRSF